MSNCPSRLVIVSNRLPVVLCREGEELRIRHGAGGLVTALNPVLCIRGGKWIGWPGTVPGATTADIDQLLERTREKSPFDLIPVHLSPEENAYYYEGASNGIFWPLFHDFLTLCDFDARFIRTYGEVNRRFAQAIAANSEEGDLVWIHDYHLMEVAAHLKDMGVKRRCAFFLHIPFPSSDIYLKLPWRERFLQALLDYDFLAFQTVREQRNFLQCLRVFEDKVTIRRRGYTASIAFGNRRTTVGALPIGMDYKAFDGLAHSKRVREKAAQIREHHRGRRLIFGVDRLDYTKGIPERLTAFELLLENHPDLEKQVTFVQLLVPSRETVREYAELRDRIERRISAINGRFTRDDWVPVVFLSRSMDREELVAHYLAADVGLVTPRKDGMNLVAKEYCAAHPDLAGVLVLSEFAGAACQLHGGALLVNPNDREGVAEALYRALTMGEAEKKTRMRTMRTVLKKHDVFWWADAFLLAATGKHLAEFPAKDLATVPSFHP